jgi:flagellar FliL protein
MAEGGKKDTGKKDAGKEEGGEATPKAAGRKKLLLLVGVAVILLAGGGGAAWYFLGKPKDEAAQAAAEQAAKAARPKTFSSLDPFVVNLADENGERLVQAGVVLEVSDAKIAADLTAQMPAVRNAILLLLSSKRSDELLTLAGKQALANEIALAAGMALGWRPAPPAPPPTARKVKATDDETKAEDAEAGTRKGDGEAKAEEAADDEAKPAKPKAAAKAPPTKAPAPNPIEGVHFSQFLVQ